MENFISESTQRRSETLWVSESPCGICNHLSCTWTSMLQAALTAVRSMISPRRSFMIMSRRVARKWVPMLP